MAATKKGEKAKIRVLALPRKHKGNIPAAAIRAAVRKVIAEAREQDAESASGRR